MPFQNKPLHITCGFRQIYFGLHDKSFIWNIDTVSDSDIKTLLIALNTWLETICRVYYS